MTTHHQLLPESDSSAAILSVDADEISCIESSSCNGPLLVVEDVTELGSQNVGDDRCRSDDHGEDSSKNVTNDDERRRRRHCCSLFDQISSISGHRKLFIVDNIISGLLIGPLTVAFWRGTWTLLDHQLFANSRAASGWLCLAAANLGLLAIVYAQNGLERWLRRGSTNRRTKDWIVGYHLYTYVLGVLNVSHWRGLWVLIDYYTGFNAASIWISFVVGQLGMMLLRSTKNALASPMIINVDVKPNFFAYSTRFNVKRQQHENFLLDALLTVFIIHQLIVAFWRGLWDALNFYLIPDNPTLSGIITIAISYVLQALVCIAEPTVNAMYLRNCASLPTTSELDSSADGSRQLNVARVRCWVLETLFYFVGNLVSVFHWRGFWILMDIYVFPTMPTLSGVVTQVVGIVGLWLMLAGNSVTMSGCLVDGESAPEDGCTMPNRYIRYFVSELQQRWQQRSPQTCSDSKTDSDDCCMHRTADKVVVFDTYSDQNNDSASDTSSENNNSRCIKLKANERDGRLDACEMVEFPLT